MNQIVLPFATVEYREPIVYLRFNRNIGLDIKEINAVSEASETVSNGKRRLLLTDVRIPANITPAGRKASANNKNKEKVIANAILVKWLGQRLIADVYMMLTKPPFPIKVFTREEDAVNWLLKHNK